MENNKSEGKHLKYASPAEKKNLDRRDVDKKIHSAKRTNRSEIRQAIKKIARGDLEGDEVDDLYG